MDEARLTGTGSAAGVRFYGPGEVRALLDYDGCIAAVRAAMADFSADGRPQPLRQIFEIAPAKFFGLMPGTLAAPHGFGAKLLSVFEDPTQQGRSAHRGVVVLGRIAGRTSSQEITLYKSLGHIVQDLAAVSYVHARARSGETLSPAGG